MVLTWQELHNAKKNMSMAKFVKTVWHQAEKKLMEKGSIKIHSGLQVYVEDAVGEQIKHGKIIDQASRNETIIGVLQVWLWTSFQLFFNVLL